MESSVAQVILGSPSLFLRNSKYSKIGSYPSQPRHGKLRIWDGAVVKCSCATGGASSVSFPEKQYGDGDDEEQVMERLRRLGFGDKCRGAQEARDVAELLECLETEAIMGEDEGKHPDDYNRRAQIFYHSSRVFQALKQSATPTTSTVVD